MSDLILPNWRTVESAPKDGSVVRLAIQWVDFHTGKITNSHNDFFWGKMKDYPEQGDVWVSNDNPDNGLYCDEDFIREIFNYETKYEKKTSYGWRGSRITGWCRPWNISYPFVSEPTFRDLIHETIKS